MAQSYQTTADTRAGEVEDKVHKLKSQAEDVANTVATEGAKVLKNASETAEDALAATRRFVEAQPLLAIGAVAVVACAAGVLWKMAPARRNTDLLERLSNYVEPGYQALRRRI